MKSRLPAPPAGTGPYICAAGARARGRTGKLLGSRPPLQLAAETETDRAAHCRQPSGGELPLLWLASSSETRDRQTCDVARPVQTTQARHGCRSATEEKTPPGTPSPRGARERVVRRPSYLAPTGRVGTTLRREERSAESWSVVSCQCELLPRCCLHVGGSPRQAASRPSSVRSDLGSATAEMTQQSRCPLAEGLSEWASHRATVCAACGSPLLRSHRPVDAHYRATPLRARAPSPAPAATQRSAANPSC